MEIDTRALRQRLAEAEAVHRQRQELFERAEKLLARKSITENQYLDAVTARDVALAQLEPADLDRLIGLREPLNKAFMSLLSNSVSFVDSISYATGDPKKVKVRFQEIEKLIQETLECSPN